MSVLTDAAAQAWTDELAAREAAVQAERQALRAAARVEVEQVIAPLTWAEAGLSFVHTDLANRLVVVSDGTVSLGAYEADGGRVYVVSNGDGQWTRGPRVESLADLGEVLAAG